MGVIDIWWRLKMKTETHKVKSVGFMDSGTGKHQSNTVYDERYICPAITTLQGGTQQIKILEITNEQDN